MMIGGSKMKKSSNSVRRRVPFVWGTRGMENVPRKRHIAFSIGSQKGIIYTFMSFQGETIHIGTHYCDNHDSIYQLIAGRTHCLHFFTKEEQEKLVEQFSFARQKRARYFKTHPEKV